MYKELIISIVILIAIFLLDYISQKYTDRAVSTMTESLKVLEDDIMKEEIDEKKAISDVNKMYNEWLKSHDILAYFIEHNELEKVETNFVAGKSYVETGMYEDAFCELEKTIFVLDHINEKYSFNLENIF